MKPITKILLLSLMVLAVLALPTRVLAQTPDNNEGKFVLGGSYVLASDQTLNDDLVVVGGTATIEKDATVNGNISLTGGLLTVDGQVNGDLVAIGGTISLGDHARIMGNVSTIGAILNQSENARVEGSITSGNPGDFNIPGLKLPAASAPVASVFEPIARILWAIFRALALAALAVLVSLLLPNPTQNVAGAITGEPLVSGGVGLLTVLVTPALLVVMVVTIILIPVALLGMIVLGLAVLFGWIVLGLEVGNRLAGLFHTDWAPAVSAGLGTLVITLVSELLGAIPCVGWVIPFIATMVGLGAVLSTRFGLRAATLRQPAPAPYAPPAPSVTAPYAPSAPSVSAPSEVPMPPSAPLPPQPPVEPEPPTAEPPADSAA